MSSFENKKESGLFLWHSMHFWWSYLETSSIKKCSLWLNVEKNWKLSVPLLKILSFSFTIFTINSRITGSAFSIVLWIVLQSVTLRQISHYFVSFSKMKVDLKNGKSFSSRRHSVIRQRNWTKLIYLERGNSK